MAKTKPAAETRRVKVTKGGLDDDGRRRPGVKHRGVEVPVGAELEVPAHRARWMVEVAKCAEYVGAGAAATGKEG